MPIATFCPHKHPFLPFFPNRNSWILNLLSYLFKKSWDWVLRWVRYKKESVFQKKDFHQFSDIRWWWWGCWCWCWCHPPSMMAPKSSKVLQRIRKGWRKRHLLVPSCFKDAELKKFLTFARKKVCFTSCDGRRISDV